MRIKQFYLPDRVVLLTRFLSETGMVELTGYMPVPAAEAGCALVRTLRCIRGGLKFRMACEPRFDYARPRPVVERKASARPGFARLGKPMGFGCGQRCPYRQ